MLEREKTILISFGSVFIAIAFAALVYFTTSNLSSYVIIGAFLLILYIYALPTFIKRYYKYHGVGDKIGISRFIPIYSELTIYSHPTAIAYLITLLVVILSGISMFIKPEIIAGVLGEKIAMEWSNYAIVIFMFAVVVWSIVKGIGFSALVREINSDLNYMYIADGEKRYGLDGIVVTIQYVVLFLPVFRAMGILLQLERLNKLVVINNITTDKVTALNADTEFEGETEYLSLIHI